MYQDKILVRQLGLQPYEPISQAMHEFTDTRDESTLDEIWLVEHYARSGIHPRAGRKGGAHFNAG
ncbi:hypothetical protein EIMP300_71160 [Escherichia coli]|uniref:Uncharacterized protein n=1 Tax=Escherichia coli TaxID=562 RepID=A0A8S0FYW3_ECOLX|nr:hypothetical protein EIMP300_71160 [Escherichia coli]